MAAHLSAFAGHIIPFGHILGPLVIWLMKRDTFAFVNDQAKEALNAQVSITLYGIGAAMLCFVLIGFPLLIGLYFADIVFVILAAIAANDGKRYRYPAILRLVK